MQVEWCLKWYLDIGETIFHPIYYFRRTLNTAQKKYTFTEQELLSVVFAFGKFDHVYLVLRSKCILTILH